MFKFVENLVRKMTGNQEATPATSPPPTVSPTALVPKDKEPLEPFNWKEDCPCCGYRTLQQRGAYEICMLCNWEDDGQDTDTADDVRGAPNSDYSLTEARENFKCYRVMYTPDRDQRGLGGDTELTYETKGLLMDALTEHLRTLDSTKQAALEAEIVRLEDVLSAESLRQFEELNNA